MALGTYPELSLAQTRKKTIEAKELLAQGIDPKPQRKNMALKRMGFQDHLVSHAMRAMASTILNEHGWDPELIEVALAHVDKDEVRSAYNRADYIERRRPMMAWWSKHIQKAATGSLLVSTINQTRGRNVVPIR